MAEGKHMGRTVKTIPTKTERDLIDNLYWIKKQSAQQIAKKLNISERTFYVRLKLHGLNFRQIFFRKTPDYCPSCGIHLQWLKQRQ